MSNLPDAFSYQPLSNPPLSESEPEPSETSLSESSLSESSSDRLGDISTENSTDPCTRDIKTRLIYLHPGGFDDDIYCTIYHANILEKLPQTEYTALSYVWGDAKHTKPIQLGYHQIPTSGTADTWPSASAPGACCYKLFQVTKNLEKALRHLRDRASERILWVDAICINQSDEEEKLSQVQSMGDVYRNAVEVRIWLGSLKDVQEVIKEDTKFVLSCERRGIEMALLAAKNYVMDDDRPLGQEANDEQFPNELQALGIRIIAMQPWWRRVWVIQEATLPKEDPIMQCGNIQVRYRKFLRMTKHCMFRDAPSILSQTQISLLVHGMFHADYVPSETSTASRILTYLSSMSGNFEVTEPQDRIYGVDGFIRMGDCHDNIFFFMTKDEHNLKDHYTFFIGLLSGSSLTLDLNRTLYGFWKVGLTTSRGYHPGFRCGNQKNGVERTKPMERQKVGMIYLPKVSQWGRHGTSRRTYRFVLDALQSTNKNGEYRKVYMT